MNTVSISQIKTSPSKIIASADEYPVAIEKRNKIQAYLIGKTLYDKLLAYVENFIDTQAVKTTDFKKGRDFEKVAKELGI